MPSFVELEPSVWSQRQFSLCKLGDARRTRRLVQYARSMAEMPDASTPRQTENWADCKAAYDLFNCEKVTFEAITEVHYRQTCQLPPGTFLVISDTTELNYGYKSKREGLGRLTAKGHMGFFLHTALVVNSETYEVMGIGAQELWTRGPKKLARVNRNNCRKRASESEVWARVMDRIESNSDEVHLIHLCDRAADNFDVFAHLQTRGDSWVIRAAQLRRKVLNDQGNCIKIGELLDSAPVIGTYKVYVQENKKQEARWAQVEVRSASVTLLRPREGSTNFVMDNDIRTVSTNVVEVREINAPNSKSTLRWVLYTREPVSSLKRCMNVVTHYERRPMVEEYHKGAKTGLSIEKRHYQSADSLEPVIGMMCIQAVRLLQLRDVSRVAPETKAERLVPPQWLTMLKLMVRNSKPIITVRDFTRKLAAMGGFLGRKCDGEPGWQTLWRGLEKLLLAIRGYDAARRH
jgi:Transposase DNA-binding/Transposase Tn5 dimerisation domain